VDRNIAVKAIPVDDRVQLIRKISSYLKDRSPSVRAFALYVVRDEVLFELEDLVLSLLSDKNGMVRRLAIECLGDFHKGEAIEVPRLYPFLRDPYDLVRIETLESLAWIGDKKALPLMAEALRDDDYLVRAYAASSIAELGGKRFRKQIESAAKAEEVETAKPFFAHALFLLGDQGQFQKLLEFLSSTRPTPRCTSANALADLPLSPDQLVSALAAVSHAARNSIANSDRSTTERVEEQLRERISTQQN
jgi:serine/threonine-protein kinase